MFVVFDLDGTLADLAHRRHFVRAGSKRDWSKFFAACSEDTPILPIIATAKALMATGEHRIEIWSGRSDEVRAQSEAWLRAEGLGELRLRMRTEGDFTPDDQLKEKWLLSEPTKPDLIFDDRAKVVDMWRRHGIICAQVAPGNF